MPDAESSAGGSDEARQKRADRRLEAALEATGGRDPRDFYRERLRELRDRDEAAYREAVEHYRTELLPAITDRDADPLSAWTEYGRRLAALSTPGRAVALDATGRARPFEAHDPGDLVLHVPDAHSERPLLVALPAELSPAQRAAYDWLVAGRRALPTQ